MLRHERACLRLWLGMRMRMTIGVCVSGAAGKPDAIKTGDDDCSKIGFRCECSLNDCLAIF